MRKAIKAEIQSQLQLVSAKEVADLMGVHVCTIKRNSKVNPKFPRPIRLNGDKVNAPVRFMLSEVQAFLNSYRTTQPQAQPSGVQP